MTLVVLDASAILALLLGEPVSEKVGAVLAKSALTVVNLGEVVGGISPATAQRNATSGWSSIPSRSALSFSTRSWPSPLGRSCPRHDEQGCHSAIALAWQWRRGLRCGR
jgi:hypothetical protein